MNWHEDAGTTVTLNIANLAVTSYEKIKCFN
jgi:hypothetical protein